MALLGWQWFFVMAGGAGFWGLVWPVPWPTGALGATIPAVLFVAIPLAVLARVAPGHRRVVSGKVGWCEVRLIVGFALLKVVVSMCVGALVRAFTEVMPNAAIAQLSAMGTGERIAFFGKTLPQLLGEDVVTLLPFLAVLTILKQHFGAGRRGAVAGAWLVSSLFFGLIHLPTYDWNFVRCIVVIGTAPIVLTQAWIWTKNIWVSTGAQILNDWLLFTSTRVGAGLAAKA